MVAPPHLHRAGSRRKNEKLKDEDYSDSIFESGLAIQPKNPHFVWRCRDRAWKALFIPKKTIRNYHLQIPNSIFLIDERGKKWETKITKRGDGRVACSSAGWRSLCKANLIQIGDVCICEFVQGLSGTKILVRVIRAHTFTRRKGAEEEEVEHADYESMKLKDQQFCDTAIFELGLAVQPKNPYFVWRSLKWQSSNELYIPLKTIKKYHLDLKIQNSIFLIDERGKKWETKIIKWGDGRLACSSVGWRSLCNANLIKIGDICICEFVQGCNGFDILVYVIRAHTFTTKKGVEEDAVVQVDIDSTYENDSDENDGDEIGMQGDISAAKHKFKSASPSAPVRRSVRIKSTFGSTKSLEEDNMEQIDECNLPEKTRWKSKDALRTIENQEAYIAKLEEIVRTLVSKDVNQKKLFDRSDSSQETHIGSPVMMSICLPVKLELLQVYFNLVRDRDGFSISLDDDVFGNEYMIYIFFDDIDKFCLLKPISDRCIIAYMWYLHKKMKKQNKLDRFRFVNLNTISYTSTEDKRTYALADRLIGASTNQLVLAPCNVGYHWILTVIDPYNNTIVLLDPLSRRVRDVVWRNVVNEALLMFGASKGENEIQSPTWIAVKAPLQPDSNQCGFYIMRYMRDIIERFKGGGLNSLRSMFTKGTYSESEIDEMRAEWAECLLDHIG